jgi:hypothetical protein
MAKKRSHSPPRQAVSPRGQFGETMQARKSATVDHKPSTQAAKKAATRPKSRPPRKKNEVKFGSTP